MDVNHLTHVVPDVSLSPSVMVESAQMYSILPPLRTGKGKQVIFIPLNNLCTKHLKSN